MPFTPAGATIALTAGLASALHIGSGAIKLATAVAAGVSTWLHSVPVVTVDVGAIGAGAGAIPLIVPPPALISGLTAGFAAQGILGPMSPLTILGLANGLSTAFAQATVITTHPGVGSGTCSVKFTGSSAVPAMIAGFASQAMTTPGSIKMATAIGIGLDITFAAFATQSPIAGAPGPSPGGGAGFGVIV